MRAERTQMDIVRQFSFRNAHITREAKWHTKCLLQWSVSTVLELAHPPGGLLSERPNSMQPFVRRLLDLLLGHSKSKTGRGSLPAAALLGGSIELHSL